MLQRKEEAAKQAAWGKAGVIIEDLKVALADAQQQLRKERAARDQLEEDMKQSFMRSVCAINLEVRLLPTTERCIELGDAKLRACLHALGMGVVKVAACCSMAISIVHKLPPAFLHGSMLHSTTVSTSLQGCFGQAGLFPEGRRE